MQPQEKFPGGPFPSRLPARERNLHLKDYLHIMFARKWILISTFLVIVLSATAWVMLQEPVYRSICRLEFKPSSLKLIQSEEVVPTPDLSGNQSAFETFLETQYELILTPAVVHKTFEHFGLRHEPDYRDLPSPEDVFEEKFGIVPLPETRLVDIVYDSFDPEKGVRILDFLVREYVDDFNRKRRQDTQQALADLERDAETIRKNLQERSEQLQVFLEENDILSFEKEEDIVLKRLLQLNESLTRAENDRIKAESRYNGIVKSMEEGTGNGRLEVDDIPEIVESQTIRNLKSELIKASMEMADLKKSFGKNHPEVQAIQATVDYIEDRIDEEKLSILSSIEREYRRAAELETDLKAELENQQGRVADLNRKAGVYKLLRQEYETTKETYDMRVKRISEIQTFLTASSTNISITSPAEVLPRPVKPRKALTIALAALVGLMLGLALCFFMEYLDTTLKTKEDVERILETPVLGYVPPITSADTNGQSAPELAALDRPESLLAEAFRSIRTALLFSATGKSLQSILVTSSMPSEGKTLVSLNLAFAMARAGKRVLLVDADMRRPRLFKIMQTEQEPGLSNLLATDGEVSLENSILSPGVENFHFLPSGPHPPNSAELLGSERMYGLTALLAERFDLVIFDTPPAFNAADAATLAQAVDGIVMVVRSFSTERDIAVRSLDILRHARGNVLGTVLNNVDVPRGGYYGYGKSYYYYYHPYDSYYSDDDEASGRGKKRRRGKKKDQADIGREKAPGPV